MRAQPHVGGRSPDGSGWFAPALSEAGATRGMPAAVDRLRAFVGIAHRLSATHDRAAVLKLVASEAKRLLAADFTSIRIIQGEALELAASAGLDRRHAARLPALSRDDAFYGAILQAGVPWWCRDVRELSDADWFARYDGVLQIRGDLVVPLIHDGRVIGAITATTREPRDWTADDVELVAALGAHAATAIHNADLFSRMEARAAQLTVVQAASARMNRARTVESVGQAIVEELRGIVDYHNARVYLLEPPEDLVPIAFAGRVAEYEIVDPELLRTTLGVGFTGWAALHGEPLLIADANADPRGVQIPGTPEVDESMLVVPMRYDDEVIGVITLSKLGLGQFRQDDLQLLLILADQAAVAVESARLLGRTETLAVELRRLLDMSSELTMSLDPRDVANVIARHVQLALGVDLCTISTWDRDGDRVVTMGLSPADTETVEDAYALGDFPETRRVLESRATVTIDTEDPVADLAEVTVLRGYGARTLAMFPLVVKGAAVGLVELSTDGATSWDERRLDLARTMTNEAAMALENARLYDQARSLADRDPLTGLYNHRFLYERLGEELLGSTRGHRPVSVLMLDIDDFKLVNDTFGHQVGDQFLVRLAAVVRSTLRGSDVPARYGGEEFCVILPDTDASAAEIAAARIHDTLRDQPFQPAGRGKVPISVSIGHATFPVDGRTAGDLIARADARMYEAKAAYHLVTSSGSAAAMSAGARTVGLAPA